MHTCTIKTKIFLLGLISLLGMILPTQQAMAEGGKHQISRDQMAIIAARGTYAFSSGNVDEPALIFTPNFVRHEQQYLTPEATVESIGKLIEHQREFYQVEDVQTEPIDIIIEGDKAVVRWVADVKPLPDVAVEEHLPSRIQFMGVTISRFEGDKIAEQWVFYDSQLVLTLTRLRYKDYFKTAPVE